MILTYNASSPEISSQKTLAAILEVITLIFLRIPTIAAPIDHQYLLLPCVIGAIDALCLPEILPHPCDLTAVAPIRTRLNRNTIQGTISLEFKIDAFDERFASAKNLLTDVNGETFKKLAKYRFFL